jgi:hypothetical protein
VTELAKDPTVTLPPGSSHTSIGSLCREWLYYESAGTRLRMAHRCIEWDGWEEGLVDSILGPEELEAEWDKFDPLHPISGRSGDSSCPSPSSPVLDVIDNANGNAAPNGNGRRAKSAGSSVSRRSSMNSLSLRGAKVSSKLPFVEAQKKEQMLDITGDICGGRGGELGRRLEAWLSVSAQDEICDGNNINKNSNENGAAAGDRRGRAVGVVGSVLNKERWLEGQRTAVVLDL